MAEDQPVCETPDDGRFNPKTPFLLLLAVTNEDGTVNAEESHITVVPVNDMKSAETMALNHAEDNGEEVYVYECRPVRRVFRPPLRILTLTKR